MNEKTFKDGLETAAQVVDRMAEELLRIAPQAEQDGRVGVLRVAARTIRAHSALTLSESRLPNH